jgi:hypothetical protein
MMDWLKGIDQSVQLQARRSERGYRQAGIRRAADWMSERAPSNPAAVAEQMVTQGAIPDAERPAAEQALGDQALRDAYIQRHAAKMNRGRGMITKRGLREGLNHQIATNAVVRRGVLPVAVGGGGVLAGAAVTTAAQDLMALMGFMEQGMAQQERVEQSPLA